MTGEPENNQNAVIPEAVYGDTYSKDPDDLSRAFLSGAKHFLEKQLRYLPRLSLSATCHRSALQFFLALFHCL